MDTHPPAALPEVLEQLDSAVAPPCAQPPGRPGERLPDVAVERSRSSTSPRGDAIGIRAGDDPRVVDDDQRRCAARGRSPNERSRTAPRCPVVDEQPRLVAPGPRTLGDQLRRQVVLELAAVHPVRTLASRPMDELREALRDGLREEAAPISRRLAEVKGLSNNAARRLERIESTLDAERTRASTTSRCWSTC